MSKTGRCSVGQSQSTRQGQVGQQISSPEPGSTGQSQPERTSEDHNSRYLSAADRSWEHEQCLQKFATHTLSVWTMKEVEYKYFLCSVAFIYKKRDELSRHLCCALFMSSHLCWGTWLFPWAPPTGSCPPPPLCNPIPRIQESPLSGIWK